MPKKLTFDEVMERVNDERSVDRNQVRADVLRRKIWQMMYSAPGCLPDHSSVCTTKEQAIESARELYAEDAPRGFMTELRRNGIAATDTQGFYRVEIVQMSVSDLF